MSDKLIDVVPEHVIVSAVRYALGRQTYIAAWTSNTVLDLWPQLSDGTRLLIARDIHEAVERAERMKWPTIDAGWLRLLETSHD